MKKLKLLFGLGILFTFGLLLGAVKNNAPTMLYAEDEVVDPVPTEDPVEDPVEEFECKVVLNDSKHGTLTADKLEGHVGDLVTLNANADFFYLVKSVSVNGTALVEDEDTTGKFIFVLVEGDNKVSATFEIDEELFGQFSEMVNEAVEGDWTSLFSVRNVIAIVAFILDGGLLFAVIRYYVKDKKLENKLEESVKKTVAKVLPETMRDAIVNFLKELITPYFAQMEASNEEIQATLTVFCRCMALSQENTPEARIAITKELSSLKNSDKATISLVEEKINTFIKEQGDKMSEVIQKLNQMKNDNQQIVESEEKAEEKPVEAADNGVQVE